MVPLGEKDGSLVFLSEKLRDIEQERGAIALRTVDVKRIFNDALRRSFDPLPRVSLHGTMAVATGLKVQVSVITSLAGDQSTIQTARGNWCLPATTRPPINRRLSQPQAGPQHHRVIGQVQPQGFANEIYRCQRIAELHRNEPDQGGQKLPHRPTSSCRQVRPTRLPKQDQANPTGRLICFPGQATAVLAPDVVLPEAAKKLLSDVAHQAFATVTVEAPVPAPDPTPPRNS